MKEEKVELEYYGKKKLGYLSGATKRILLIVLSKRERVQGHGGLLCYMGNQWLAIGMKLGIF